MLPLLHVDWSPNKVVGQRQEAAEPGLPAKNVTGQNKIYGTKTIMHVNNCYPDLNSGLCFSCDNWWFLRPETSKYQL